MELASRYFCQQWTFVSQASSFLKSEDGNDTAKKVNILTADPSIRSGSFFKMTGYPSFELIEAKSDPIFELGNICVSLELLPLRKKCLCRQIYSS